MATGSVETQSTVELNSVKYWLGGDHRIKPQLISVFPDKQVIGDYTADSNPLASSWSISDLTEGLGVMEMDEGTDAKKFWFANATTNYRGHVRLPKLATSVTTPSYYGSTWTSPTGSSGTWTNHAYARDDDTSTYATETIDATSTGSYLTLTIAATDCNRVRMWFTRETTDIRVESLDVYYASAWHNVAGFGGVVGEFEYEDLVTTPKSDTPVSVTQVRVRFNNLDGGSPKWVRVHEIDFGKAEVGTTFGFAEFNSVWYMYNYQALFKLNATGDGWTDVKTDFHQGITDLSVGVNACLYIGQGAGENYWYMTAAEVLAQTTNTSGVNKWALWDDKQFYLDAATNIIYYTVTPNTAAPAWTANGTLDIIPFGDVNNLYVDQNSAGNQVIFAATKQGLFEHDYTNAKFIHTGLKIPKHPNGGMGAAVWREYAYISAGLDVLAYSPSSEGDAIASVGLSRNDGLPAEYNGEITKLVAGYNELYALVDSTQATGTSTSFIAAYDGTGWSSVWVAPSTEGYLNAGGVSSVFAYRLWFVHAGTTYYLPIERGIRNPSLLSTYTYDTAGFLVTSWFDGGWLTGNKRANQVRIGTSGVSANETIVVKYRINHATTALASTWTTLGTITSGTETVYSFGSSAGVTFKDIQFRFDLARGGTNTNSPEIRYVTLEYNKIIPKVWGWTMVLDLSRDCDGKNAKQLLANLVTAAETETLMTFRYESTTAYYVEVIGVNGDRTTGTELAQGEYQVALREVV